MMPAAYKPAAPHCVYGVDAESGDMGFAIKGADGVARFRMPRAQAQWLAVNLLDQLGLIDQSSMASLIPNVDGSPQAGQLVVPAARSSKALCGEG